MTPELIKIINGEDEIASLKEQVKALRSAFKKDKENEATWFKGSKLYHEESQRLRAENEGFKAQVGALRESLQIIKDGKHPMYQASFVAEKALANFPHTSYVSDRVRKLELCLREALKAELAQMREAASNIENDDGSIPANLWEQLQSAIGSTHAPYVSQRERMLEALFIRHLSTMQDINASLGYKFSQPLIATQKSLEALAKNDGSSK